MPLNKKRLNSAKLYLILDAGVLSYQELLKVLKDAVRFGVDIVQLRSKIGTPKDILAFSKHAIKITKHRVPFIVNDRVDLALLAGADGVHVGQEDIAYQDARRLMGPKALIGVSCQSLAQARKAQADGADYIGFGSVFKTLTKPERNPMDLNTLSQVYKKIQIPVFAIGGISRSNVDRLTAKGINRVAVCRDILLAQDVAQTMHEWNNKLK